MKYNDYMTNSAKLPINERIEAIENQIEEETKWLAETCNPRKVRYREKYIKSLKKQLKELNQNKEG